MGTIAGFPTADGFGVASVDSKLKTNNGTCHAFLAETIPIAFDKRDNGVAYIVGAILTDAETLEEFGRVDGRVKRNDIRAGPRLPRRGSWPVDGFTVFGKVEHAVINIVGIFDGNITIDLFGTPMFWRKVDDEDRTVNWMNWLGGGRIKEMAMKIRKERMGRTLIASKIG